MLSSLDSVTLLADTEEGDLDRLRRETRLLLCLLLRRFLRVREVPPDTRDSVTSSASSMRDEISLREGAMAVDWLRDARPHGLAGY
jgi:hypothetical protein